MGVENIKYYQSCSFMVFSDSKTELKNSKEAAVTSNTALLTQC